MQELRRYLRKDPAKGLGNGRLHGLTRVLGLCALTAVLLHAPAQSQNLERPVRIGVLTAAWGPPAGLRGFIDGLVDLGHRENEDFVIGLRFTQGDLSALPAAASAMVDGGVDLIYAAGEPAVRAVQDATSTHPIIFQSIGDPVGRGLIESYARPGGNVTGVTDLNLEVSGRRLQLFKELIPGLERVLFPYDANNSYDLVQAELYRAAARRLNIVLVELGFGSVDEAQAALSKIRHSDVDGIVSPRDVAMNIPGLVLQLAASERIPTMFALPVYMTGGGVASYAGSSQAIGRQAARLADKIIQGTDPADIPVETAQRLEFVINLKAAQELGIDVPREVLFQADRIIR